MNKKGQGTVWFWLSSLVGIMVVILVYIVFDTVLFADTNSIESALIPMGLNTSSSPYTALVSSWNLWPIALVFAWIFAMVVRSIIKEPGYGY
jgi:hypothetical protein